MYLNILTFLDWFNKPFLDSTLTNFQFVVLCLGLFTLSYTFVKIATDRKKPANRTYRKKKNKK